MDTLTRHHMLVMAGVEVRSAFDDDPYELDEVSAALVDALSRFDDEERRAKPLRIPKGFKGAGRFRKVSDLIFKALADWANGEGPDNPFDSPDLKDVLHSDPAKRREQLRQAAKARGLTLRRGASFNEIANQVLDDFRKGKGEHHDAPDAKPKAPAKKATPRVPAKKAAPPKKEASKPEPGAGGAVEVLPESARPLSEDELWSMKNLSARGHVAEGGWVEGSALTATHRHHLDALAKRGLVQKHVGPDGGTRYRIDTRTVGTQMADAATPDGGALSGDVLPPERTPESRLSLSKVNRGAIIEGYRNPDGSFGNVPQDGTADPARVIRVVVQRQDPVDENGQPVKGLFLQTHRRIIGHDAATGRRVESEPVAGGSYWSWVMNPDTDTSADIEGELVTPRDAIITTPDPEAAGRAEQARIDAARPYADVAGQLDEFTAHDARPEAVLARLDAAAERHGIADELDPVRAAVESGDTGKARAEMDRLLTAHGITRDGEAGQATRFDPKTHQSITGRGDLRAGQPVEVVRPGFTLTRDGQTVRLSKATVEAADEADEADDDLGPAPAPTYIQPTAENPVGSHTVTPDDMRPSVRNGETVEIRFGIRKLRGVVVGETTTSTGERFLVIRHPDGTFNQFDERALHVVPTEAGSTPAAPLTARQEYLLNVANGNANGKAPLRIGDEDAARDLHDRGLAKYDPRARFVEITGRGQARVKELGSTPPIAPPTTTPDPEALRDSLDLKTVPELKAMLRERGLPVSGRKRELVDRLVGDGGGAGEVAAPKPANADDLAPSGPFRPVPKTSLTRDERIRQLVATGMTWKEAKAQIAREGRSDDMDAEARSRVLALAEVRYADHLRAAGHDVTPGHDELHHWWVYGAGRKRWHDWTSLYDQLAKIPAIGPVKAKKYASAWFLERFGYASGSDINRVKHGKPPRGHRVGPG